MNWLRQLRARIKYRRFDAELREELEMHRAMKEADLRARGASAGEARAAASRALGNVALAREDARGVWLAPRVESVWQDVRYAARSLRRSPGFTAAAVLTLGFGIGVNVSVFTVFNVLALKGWDVRDPGTVVLPFAKPVGKRGYANWVRHAEYAYLRDRAAAVSVVAYANGSGRVFQSDGTDYDRPSDYVQFNGVSSDFFNVLGVDVVRGRGFLPGEDDVAAPAAVAVVTHTFWRQQLGGDPAVIGRTIRMGVRNVPVTVVGVTRPGFAGVDRVRRAALFVPLPLLGQVDGTTGRWDPETEDVRLAGRVAPGRSREEAAAELDTLSRQYRASAGLESHGMILTGTRPIEQPGRTGQVLPGLAGFGAAVLLVLLLACANVGNLQLARALARRRELAVRLSLGAARARLIRQLLTESACVAMAAAMLGFALSWLLPDLLLRLAGERGEASRFLPDATVFGVSILLGGVTALLFALAPALRATAATEMLALRARTDLDRGGRRLRSLLLGAQVALSLTLLTAAGLLTRGVLHAHHVDFGFDASRVAVARIGVPKELYTRPALTAFRHDLEVRLRASTVGPTAFTNVAPLDDSPSVAEVRRPGTDESWNVRARSRRLSASGFALLGLTFVAGGPYREGADLREAIVNQTLARQLWPGEAAVGRTVLADGEEYTITGVVRDTYYTTPAEIVPIVHRAPELTSTSLLFRSDRPNAAAELQAIIHGIEPRLRVTVAPLAANIEASLRTRRFAAGLTWAVGLLGLCLATIGVFGVFAYAVEERRREIGLRLALGARPPDIFRALFDVNRRSVGGGLAAGLLLSVIAGFALRGYLFGLSPLDPLAYAAVCALMGVAAALATAVPARRALRVDPAVTLKSE